MRAWLEVDLSALRHNISTIRDTISDNKIQREIIGVIKANAYGFESIEIAHELQKCGVSTFGVATVEEGIELRQNGISDDILVLGSLFDDEIVTGDRAGFHMSICSMAQLEYIAKHASSSKVHLKVDTGMGRVGFLPEEVEDALTFCHNNNIKITGIYSHLSDADGDSESARNYTLEQIAKFKSLEKYCEQYDIKYFHIFNSGAICNYTDHIIGTHVRPGLIMYGMLGNQAKSPYQSVFTMKGRVIYKRKVTQETPISYGRTATVHPGHTFVTLSVGYADGVKRAFSNKMYVKIHGEKCPIIGNICMDMCVSQLPPSIADITKVGDEVTIFDAEIISDISSDTACSWEILTGIGRRVHRIYKHK